MDGIIWLMKMYIKKLPGISLYYKNKDRMRHERLQEELAKNGMEIISDVQRTLAAKGIVSFVAFGTLLGIVRERGIIKHDNDIDIAFVIDRAEEWSMIQSALTNVGYSLKHEFYCDGILTEQTYTHGIVQFDVFALYPIANGKCRAYLYLRHMNKIYKKHHFSVMKINFTVPATISEENIEGYCIALPSNFEIILRENYGNMWNIPDPNYRYEDYWEELPDADGLYKSYE